MQYRRPAFTLIELLVVIAIIGILSALVVTQLGASQIKARNATAQSDIAEMEKAVESFRIEDAASGQVVSNLSGTVDQQGGGRSDFPSLFTGTQNVGSLTYAATVSKTPGPPYVYRYVASGTQAGQTGRQLVKGAVNQPVYALCTTLVAAPTPYFCATDTAGGGGSQSDQVLAAQGLGNLSAAATNGLAAWYKLDESGTATVASDSSGSGNNGSLANFSFDNVTNGWVNGKFGKALLFNGSSDYVNIPNSSTLNGTDSLSVSTWVYPTSFTLSRSYGNSLGVTLIESNENGTATGWIIGTNNSGNIWWWPSGGNDRFSTKTLPLNAWSHVIIIYSSGYVSFYINGVLSNTTASVSPNIPTFIKIGAKSWTSSWLAGSIDDVRIYNRALTANEVQQLYKGTL